MISLLQSLATLQRERNLSRRLPLRPNINFENKRFLLILMISIRVDHKLVSVDVDRTQRLPVHKPIPTTTEASPKSTNVFGLAPYIMSVEKGIVIYILPWHNWLNPYVEVEDIEFRTVQLSIVVQSHAILI